MCYRYFLLKRDLQAAAEKLRARLAVAFDSRYNLPPTTAVPAVRATGASGVREVALLQWGLVPGWAKERATHGAALANARAESLADKPAFREAFRGRRCVLPASGFYEWETRGAQKLPWLFRRRNEQPLLLAGLWESWRAPEGDVLESCAIITTEPNDLLRPIHDRMPAILSPEDCDAWLDPAEQAPARTAPLLRPWPAADMVAHRVSPRVNRVTCDDAECVQPVEVTTDQSAADGQLGLGLE
ncbi:MAG: SOS response-associated peptidase [Opitutae bacterium]|nr:SOS response-associated peptidase [Opitutae bacterium]